MQYSLDTHTILWYLFGDNRLSKDARNIIESNVCFYSYASFWEISINTPLTYYSIIMVCMCLLAFTDAVYAENWKYSIPGI